VLWGRVTRASEQTELRAVVRSLMDRSATSQATRRHMEADAFDRTLWATMATDIGLHGLAIPERFGGLGAGWSEQAVVFEELGRSLACVPYLATVGLASSALLAADAQAQERWLPSIAAGSLTATFAFDRSASVGRHVADPSIAATHGEHGWYLSGRAEHVLDGASADLVLVEARSAEGVGVFAVEGDVTAQNVNTSDQTRRVAHLAFDGVPATRIGGAEVVAAGRRAGTAMLASEQTGGASFCLDQAVSYAATRHQFGRPIGSFQAVQHHCADMLVAVEIARSATRSAARACDDEAVRDDITHLIAGATASDSYAFCASMNVQVHGGIGCTWEHDAHLHVKRSRGSMVLLATPAEHRRDLVHTGKVLVSR
jgi:alkylation response protein AidB-like acyl-CoA dehydrogenase